MKQLIRAAERGSASEQFNLGVLYTGEVDDNGYAIKPDRAKAMKWFKRAAQQGLPRAQIELARLYTNGGLPQDRIRACAWFLLASKALGGIHREIAQSGYESIAMRLSPDELGEARRFTLAWKPNCGMDQAG